MVLLLLCGVKREAIVEDYMMSEQVLKQSRMHDELDLDGACVGMTLAQAGSALLVASDSGAGFETACGAHAAGGPKLGIGIGLGQLAVPSYRPPSVMCFG